MIGEDKMKYIGIKNNLQFPQIELPKCLSSRINICTNVDLKLDEIEAFSESLTLLQKQLEFENILAKDIRFINIIFTDNFEYTFVNTIPRTFGLLQNIIVYAVGNLRIENSSRVNYMGVFLEELCHHIYGILKMRLL